MCSEGTVCEVSSTTYCGNKRLSGRHKYGTRKSVVKVAYLYFKLGPLGPPYNMVRIVKHRYKEEQTCPTSPRHRSGRGGALIHSAIPAG